MADEDEFTEFVAAALPGLLRFGHVLTGNAATAEDLVQTALGRSLRAWRLSPGHALDVGCGLGSEAAHLNTLGWRIVGRECG